MARGHAGTARTFIGCSHSRRQTHSSYCGVSRSACRTCIRRFASFMRTRIGSAGFLCRGRALKQRASAMPCDAGHGRTRPRQRPLRPLCRSSTCSRLCRRSSMQQASRRRSDRVHARTPCLRLPNAALLLRRGRAVLGCACPSPPWRPLLGPGLCRALFFAIRCLLAIVSPSTAWPDRHAANNDPDFVSVPDSADCRGMRSAIVSGRREFTIGGTSHCRTASVSAPSKCFPTNGPCSKRPSSTTGAATVSGRRRSARPTIAATVR